MSSSAAYVRFRLSVIKTETPLTVSQEIIMQPGVRCAAPASQHKRKGNNEVPQPFTSPPDTYHPKEFYLFPWAGQRPQKKCKEFNRLLNSQTARYKHDRTQGWPVTLVTVVTSGKLQRPTYLAGCVFYLEASLGVLRAPSIHAVKANALLLRNDQYLYLQ
jgi:hypothetical protein